MTNVQHTLEARASRGDFAAFGDFIHQVDHDLRGVVWAVVRNREATDDVMQTSYEKALRSIGQFSSRSSLKTWMHSICYRTALDHIRYESYRRHEEIDRLAGAHTDPLSVPSAAIAKLELAEVLEHLEPDQRAMLMLTVGLGFSYDEAAVITGTPRGTVASRVNRARKTIEARMTDG